MAYVPALDGLRALSLVAILLYHNGFLWARGGFLGVTVFFTLSGFLICSLLVTEHERSGTIRLRTFWGRRARRLVPAVLALLGGVVALVAVGVVTRSSSLVSDAAATATWVANWRFIASGQSYANLYGDPSPFQHMWSLAVEEQFYLLLPLLLLVCLRRRRGGGSRRLRTAVVLAALAVTSTILCGALSGGAATRAYFGTDTRVAEPLVGALLALALTRSNGAGELRGRDRRVIGAAALVSLLGLALLTWRLGEYDERLYRGGFLLAAVLAAVVVAAATQPRTLVARALSTSPLVGLGRISYGGYVYHWPIFIWLDSRRTGLDGWSLFAVRVLVTLAVAAASYVFVEMPVRRGRLRPRLALAGWVPATAALVVAVAMAAPVSVGSTEDSSASGAVSAAAPPLPVGVVASRPIPAKHATAHVVSTRRADPRAVTVATHAPSATSTPMRPAVVMPTQATAAAKTPAAPLHPRLRVAVVGDSLANNLADGLTTWEKTSGQIAVYNLAIKACPLVPGGTRRWPDGYTWDVKPECAWWQDASSSRMQALRQFDPQVIVVEDGANELPDRKEPSWATYDGPGDGIYDSWMINGYQQAISTFTSVGNAKVVLLNSVCADWNNLQHWEGQGHPAQRNASVNFDYQQLAAGRYSLQDLDSYMCPSGQFTDTVDGVKDARPDGFHLSDAAALAVARDWLEPILLTA